jgi:hypothetical protein
MPYYFHFLNTLKTDTILKVNVYKGVQYYWCPVAANGGTGVPYAPAHQDWRYNITFYETGSERVLGGLVYLTVNDTSLLCELVSLGDGQLGNGPSGFGNHAIRLSNYKEP